MKLLASETSVLSAWLDGLSENRVLLPELCELWRFGQVIVLCPGAAGIARNPNAPAKIRGAWGRALADGASAGALNDGECDWDPPCTYDFFFNTHGRLTAGLDMPKPFVFGLMAEQGDLLVMLNLFGIAADRAGEAGDALVRALRGGLDTGERRRPVLVESRTFDETVGVEAPNLSGGALLDFQSPLVLRSGQDVHADPMALITTLANRVSGLARWHGVGLTLDSAAVKTKAAELAKTADWVDPSVLPWTRRSRAQGRAHQVRGVEGVLRFGPVDRELSMLLALGATCHVGGRAALGLGRFMLHGING